MFSLCSLTRVRTCAHARTCATATEGWAVVAAAMRCWFWRLSGWLNGALHGKGAVRCTDEALLAAAGRVMGEARWHS